MVSIDDQNSVLQCQLGRILLAPIGINCGMMFCNVLDDKQCCICTRQLLPQLGRILLVQIGILIPVWARRIPISAPSHLQLGGTLVPRSTRHCLPPPPQLHICCSPSIYNQLIIYSTSASYGRSRMMAFQWAHPPKGSLSLQKRMNFRKSYERPLTPPPSFSKIMLRIFSKIHDRSTPL